MTHKVKKLGIDNKKNIQDLKKCSTNTEQSTNINLLKIKMCLKKHKSGL